MGEPIKKITIEGFKSIRSLKDFELRPLNVLIGANGAGKSNFVGFFGLLRELVHQRLQLAVVKRGGADAVLHFGPKGTKRLNVTVEFGDCAYEFVLEPTEDNRLVFGSEMTTVIKDGLPTTMSYGSGQNESEIEDYIDRPMMLTPCYTSRAIFESVSNCLIYHFDDTSETAGVRRWGAINDNEYLRPDAANLAAFLFRLQSTDSSAYAKIRDAVGLTAPFFDDFKLRPIPQSPEMIQLEWTQKGSDYPFRPSQLSDGTLRFICLATALLQPSGPSVMLFDEPELGLHPYALNLLAALFQQASISVGAAVGRQVIISTQSAALVDEFAPEDVVVVERAHGESTFWRLDAAPLVDWLKEYSLGELWLKNILGGRPQSDATAIPQESFSDRGDKK